MKEYNVKVYEDKTEWRLNGKLHREDGNGVQLPAREHTNGDKFWYVNGEYHREDGPALEWADGSKFWSLNGKLHREDGPAVECSNGYKEWWIRGVKVTEEEVMGKPKELTVSEISELLGYGVKVVR